MGRRTKCRACGVTRRNPTTQSTPTDVTVSMPTCQPAASPIGAAIRRPDRPPIVVPAMYVPAARVTAKDSTSSTISATARAATPPWASPSAKRRASSSGKEVASPPATANTQAATMDTAIARRRPQRSEAKDHGITDSARPAVAAETRSAASWEVTCRSAATSGSRPCGE